MFKLETATDSVHIFNLETNKKEFIKYLAEQDICFYETKDIIKLWLNGLYDDNSIITLDKNKIIFVFDNKTFVPVTKTNTKRFLNSLYGKCIGGEEDT